LLSLLMAGAIALAMPALARPERMRVADQMRILGDRGFVANVALSVLVFSAMFGAYTYLADTLERVAGIAPSQVGWWLMGFGAIGLVGNWLGGHVVDRHPLRATAGFTLLLALGMLATVPAAGGRLTLALALAVWGIAYTALFPICQVRVMKAGASAPAFAGTLNVAAANAGIGIGAIVGGLTITHLGLGALEVVAAGLAGVALVLAPLVARLARR